MSAAAAACKRGFVNLYSTHHRHISQLGQSTGKRAFLVDTLALVRRLEAQGIPSKQAEAITEALRDSLENVADSFVSKSEMHKSEMVQDSDLSKFKSEVQSSQEHHFSMLQHETEKLRSDIQKMSSELRYEIRAQFDEISAQLKEGKHETAKLSHTLIAQLEAAKYDVIKYCIGTVVSVSAVGLAIVRMLM
ncbi:DUF1640 domain-containing protein [Cephalotus follicularis]|uniref:DUF1640 domain-containing protein n=1 Tax=Cephalotus follicularis TaxID=3775 RepID=A0A1Q3CW12_CEPFO|nr:DUF1640 domain-containing protein [Cephalotus follicularis]